MSVSGTWLITGLRGNGKTLKAVQMMAAEVAAGRQVFASNFKDLNVPGVEVFDDPKQWQELPPGSVLFVDEAQRFWRSRRSGDPAPEVIAMETQRHDGISMVLLTQQPTYLDKHVRGLVDFHVHLIRRAGLPASQSYYWERCKEEPESSVNVDLAEKSIWPFPTEFYGCYTSAEVHTVKRRIPARVKLIAAAAVAVAGMLWWAVNDLGSDAQASEGATSTVPAEGGTGDAPPTRTAKPKLTLDAYWDSMKPRIEGAPFSAPIYDEVNRVSDPPDLVCMIGSECRCITTDGIWQKVQDATCRLIVKNGGIPNPYKRRRERNDWQQSGEPASGGAATATASHGTVISGEQVSGYGDLGFSSATGAAP